MHPLSHPHAEWIRQALVSGSTPEEPADPCSLARWVEHNRLGPWLYERRVRVPGPVDGRAAYRAQAWKGERMLRTGVALAAALQAEGIPCLCFRGPFHGAWLYGSSAARPCQDIDLLVPRNQARAALAIARAAGFQAAIPGLKEAFYLRHHLHWQLIQPREGVICDLHWAVEHPYRLHRVDYPALFAAATVQRHGELAWSRPGNEHALLLDLLHFHKHFGRVHAGPDEWTRVCSRGEALHLLDAALLVRAHGSALDWDVFLRSAVDWRVEEETLPPLLLAGQVFDLEIPATVRRACPAAPATPPAPRSPPFWLVPLAARAGFRPEKWHDAAAYVWPEPRKLGAGGHVLRVLRAPAAALRLAVAGADILASHWLAAKAPAAAASDTPSPAPSP